MAEFKLAEQCSFLIAPRNTMNLHANGSFPNVYMLARSGAKRENDIFESGTQPSVGALVL